MSERVSERMNQILHSILTHPAFLEKQPKNPEVPKILFFSRPPPQSRSREASRDSAGFHPTKESSPYGPWLPPRSPKAHQEIPPSPKEEGRRAPSPPSDPQRQHGHTPPPQQPPAAPSVETKSTLPERVRSGRRRGWWRLQWAPRGSQLHFGGVGAARRPGPVAPSC